MALLAASPACAATVELGYFSFRNLVPASGSTGGVNTFRVVNLTGSNDLPQEASVTTAVTFQNASVTYTPAGGSPVTVQLGNIAPGSTGIQLPDSVSVSSATFNATLSTTLLTLAGNAEPQSAVSGAISISVSTLGAAVPIFITTAAPTGTLTLVTDKSAYAIGQTVTLSGGFTAPGAAVAINLTLGSITHTLSATTGTTGAYSVTYQPTSAETGTFSVSATAAGSGSYGTASATFRVIGLQLTTNSSAITLVMGSTASPLLTILNSGDASIGSINVTFSSNAPASVTGSLALSGVPAALAIGASANFALNVNTSTAPPPGQPVTFTVTASGVDSASGTSVSQVATVTVTLEPPTSSANLQPLTATLGVNPGATATQQYSVTNNGYVVIPNAMVALTNPSATPWIVLGNASLGTIAPGATVSFQAIANPPAALAAQTVSVPFTITGASSTVSATLTVNVNPTGTTTGSASFNVSDDLGQYVSSAMVTLISKATPSLTYQGASDANGNVTLTGVTAGDYGYVIAAPTHDPFAGSVHVSAGGGAQPELKLTGKSTASPISVVMTYDVVTLSFSVTPTTITDTYVTQLQILYSSFLVKPVLQVIPGELDYSFYPQTSYPPYPQCFPLKITNLHPTSEVTNVTVDSSQLDLATPAGARFQVFLFGPNSKPTDQTQTINLGNLSGQHLATTPSGSPVAPPITACGTVNAADLITRSLGNITVSGQYAYSNPGGIAAIGTTTTPVPVTYTFHPDVYAQPIYLYHDPSVSSDDLRPLDSNYPIYNITSERSVSGTFLNPQNNIFGGENLVGYSQTVTTTPQVPVSKSDLQDILANTPLWRANFKAGKTAFNPVVGDVASYDISGTDYCNTDLVSCLRAQIRAGNGAILGEPNYVGLGVQWADRPVGSPVGGPDGYKVPIVIVSPISISGAIGGAFTPISLPGSCTSQTVSNYYQPIQCGQILIDIPITQKFEREAFNISLGIGVATTLTNVHAGVSVKDASGNDASSLFTLIVANDPQGATTGGTVSSAESLQWQLIPKAGAGGASGAQYNVSSTFSYTANGQAQSMTTNTVSITVMPLPQLQISYAVPFLAIQNKTEKIRMSVTNTGSGVAHNFTAAAAQPTIQANPSNTESAAAFNWNFTVNGSSPTANGALQAGVTTISFGDIQPGATVSGYFGIVVSNCNYNDSVLHTDCGYILDSQATIKQQDYNGVALDPLVGTPTVQFVPAAGGTVCQYSGATCVVQPGLTVTATRNGAVLGSDTTDAGGGYFIGDLTAGPATITVTSSTGSVLSTNSGVTLLADSSTNFIDFNLPQPTTPNPVSITVNTSVAGIPFTVDGIAYTAPHTFTWNPGDTHSLSTVALQAGATGTQYVFASWSNGGSMTQGLPVPSVATTYTANFTTQYLLTTAVSPANSGTLTPGAGYVNAGTVVTLTATAATGYTFASFSSGLTGTLSPATVTMSAPVSVVANFAPIAPLLTLSVPSKTGAASARAWTIMLANSGSGIGLNTQLTSMTFTGTGCTTQPAIVQPAAGISTATPFPIGTIGPLGSASGTVTINFSGCPSTTKFTVKIGYTANSGAYSGTTTLNNQFQ